MGCEVYLVDVVGRANQEEEASKNEVFEANAFPDLNTNYSASSGGYISCIRRKESIGFQPENYSVHSYAINLNGSIFLSNLDMTF